MLILFCATSCLAASTRTTTTTYAYNADGAPTAITTQVDAGPATTVYLTWDNFTPDAGAPSTGTVAAADGNLLGIGASPGTVATAFTYDVRDRLTGCARAGEEAVSYAYHPNSLMASSALAGGDELQFYYDNGAAPRMINTTQPATGAADSFLGPVRYVSDGTQQALLKPRKDVAGVYDAAAQTLAPYGYDPYGAPSSDIDLSPVSRRRPATSDQRQDLVRNPFRYAGEYQDPICGAYYLRARWYLAEHETFLSRDPIDRVHRYGYTGGNPIGRVDPSGLRYTGADFSRGVGRALHRLMPGVGAYLEPLLPVWGQVLGGIQLLGELPAFFHKPTIEQGVDFGFLAASMVAEVGGETRAFDARFATPFTAFRARIGIDLVLGGSQTLAQSFPHGRIDAPTVIQGAELTASGIFWGRLVGGLGYRPYNLSATDVELGSVNQLVRDDDILIFRARTNQVGTSGQTFSLPHTSPLLERLHLGLYHESVIAFSREEVLLNHLTVDDDGYAWITSKEIKDPLSDQYQYMYAGRVERSDAFRQIVQSSPLDIPIWRRAGSVVSVDSDGVEDIDPVEYSKFGNNCQVHAAAVRRALGL